MRILHVLPHRGGGAETYIDMLERLEGFEHQRYPLSAGRSPASALASLPRSWPALRRAAGRADVVHCHGDVATILAMPAVGSRPAVMTGQGLHMLRRVAGGRRVVMVRALRYALSRCRTVICSSQAEREDLAAVVAPGDRDKLVIVHNAVDAPAGDPGAGRGRVRAELGVADDTVLGVFVGQLEPRKAPLLAARAATKARAEGASFTLAVLGAGPLEPELRELESEAVKLLGYREDVGRVLAAGDIFLAPSEREGMSFALLEAMSHGLAVVAADASSNPEAVGEAGLLFAPGDASACAALLAQLASDGELRAGLGAKAARRAAEEYSPERFLDASRRIYLEAAGVRAPALPAASATA